ncbi:TrbG/VirB9 family P-type conjugative transfer protein [Sphingorhabdus sp.]|uniref:TrbG/VirB9 family P-type conjugative transfer protein n=1 Tax=Sphingorhabdus sp. TaxID=1902408 RepID=UPI003593FA94
MIGLMLFALLPVAGLVDAGAVRSPASISPSAFVGQNSETGRYGNAVQTDAGVVNAQPVAAYRLSGEKSLRPVRIGDDGTHMYLEWDEEQALPAVFALNALGEEEMVDGYMRSGVFTIDRVHRDLVFRIGKKSAKAKRVGK